MTEKRRFSEIKHRFLKNKPCFSENTQCFLENKPCFLFGRIGFSLYDFRDFPLQSFVEITTFASSNYKKGDGYEENGFVISKCSPVVG